MSKELQEKKNDLIVRAETVLNKAKEEKRELTEDEAAELAEIRDNVRRIIDTLKLDDDFRELGMPLKKKNDGTPTEGNKGGKPMMNKEQKQRALEESDRQAFELYPWACSPRACRRTDNDG